MLEKETFTHQLSRLVEIPSVSEDTRACSQVVDYTMSILPPRVEVTRWQNNRVETLMASVGPKHFSPDVAFIVHADVVRAVNIEQYHLETDGDKLFGRGTSDMKFSIPIGVALLDMVRRFRPDLSYTFVVTTDEEIGGKNGVKSLVNDRGFTPRLVIVPDAGDGFNLVDKTKGLASIKVDIKGKAAHSSEIWRGRSANHELLLLGSKLVEKYQKNNSSEGWCTTMNIGIFNGGEVSNQVSPKASMNLDFRFPESDTAGRIVEEIKLMAKEVGPEITVSLLGHVLPFTVDTTQKNVKLLVDEFEKVLGRKINMVGGTGVTDARHFNKSGIECLMIKPDGGDIHGENEWVSLIGCMTYFEAISNFLKKVS